MCTSPLRDLLRQVQAQDQEEVSEKGRHAQHTLQGQPGDHTLLVDQVFQLLEFLV